MNAMELNTICLKWFYSQLFQSVFKILASRRKWWREEQGAKGWFCFVLLLLLNFLLKTVLWEWVSPWERQWMLHWKHQTLQCRDAHLTISWDTQLSASPCCDRTKACQGLWTQSTSAVSDFSKSVTWIGLTPDLWCWGKRTLSLSTVAGLTFAEGNPGLIFMTFFCS